MVALKENLKKILKNALKEAFPEKNWDDFQISLKIDPKGFFGDFVFSCFELQKIINQKPDQIALSLQNTLTLKKEKLIKKTQAAGPYLNLTIEPVFLIKEALNFKNFGFSKKKKSQKPIMIEFSSPNTNKPQHLGHLRNNFLGQALANILEKNGKKVIKTSLINDRGIHICKAMVAYQKWGKNQTPKSAKMKGDYFVGNFYVAFEKEHKKQAKEMKEEGKVPAEIPDEMVATPLMLEAREMLQKWEQKDKETMALWRKMRRWVLQGFRQTYKRIGVKFDVETFESEIFDIGRQVIFEALKKKILQKGKDGAVFIDLTKEGFGVVILLRKDGTCLYITQDIGLAKIRFEKYNLEKLIYVVGSEQNYRFKVLFKILSKLGFDFASKCYHLSYGMVNLPEGKMKSREGKVVEADTLIDQMSQMALKIIKERGTKVSQKGLKKLSEAVALGAIKFFLLKADPQKNITFNPQNSLKIEESTGPYLQYTFARIHNVLKKAQKTKRKKENNEEKYKILNLPEELRLAKMILLFPEILQEAGESYNPAKISHFLLDLARLFNEFYQKYKIINPENPLLSEARLNLTAMIKKVFGEGLKILGIPAPLKM
jgi:arginyl-tRNA synthetase